MHCLISGGINRRVLPRCEQIKLLNIPFLRVGIEPTTYHAYDRTLVKNVNTLMAIKFYKNVRIEKAVTMGIEVLSIYNEYEERTYTFSSYRHKNIRIFHYKFQLG